MSESEINSILMDPTLLENAKLFAKINGKDFNSNEDIVKYFITERNNALNPNSNFKNAMQIIAILRDPEIMENAKIYVKIAGVKFENNLDIVKYFIAERNNSNNPNSNFKDNMQIITILRDPEIMENAKYYAKLTQKSFDNPIDLAKYFKNERTNPDFAENMQKAIQLKIQNRNPIQNNNRKFY